MMERFLERISLSDYKDRFILKSGMLVAAMVGPDARSTMDLDAMVKEKNYSYVADLSWHMVMDSIRALYTVGGSM